MADAVWRRSPAACLVFDDVHLLPAGSPGAQVGRPGRRPAVERPRAPGGSHRPAGAPRPAALPGRGAPRRRRRPALHRRGGGELAADRGWSDVEVARVGGRLAGDDRAGRQRARAPCRRLPVGGSARPARRGPPPRAGGGRRSRRGRRRPRWRRPDEPVDLGAVLDGVPLIASDDRGWRAPHPLWRTDPALALADDDRRQVRRLAVVATTCRGASTMRSRSPTPMGVARRRSRASSSRLPGPRPTARRAPHPLARRLAADRRRTSGASSPPGCTRPWSAPATRSSPCAPRCLPRRRRSGR